MTPSMETMAPTIIFRMGHSPCLNLGRTARQSSTSNCIRMSAMGPPDG
jgi:hypothetical protein